MENKQSLITQVEEALDEVRPHLQVDGGNVKLVDITDDYIVYIEWEGNCQNCDMSEMTLKAGITQSIKNRVPQITSVRVVSESDAVLDD